MSGRLSHEDRLALCQERAVTLDGHPAVISGARERFASVRTLTGGYGTEWAWSTVARVVANGGDFRS